LPSLTDIRGIGPALSKSLAGLGITGPEALARAVPATLIQVRGISLARAHGFIDAARALGETPPSQPVAPAGTRASPAPDAGSATQAKSSGKKDGAGKAAGPVKAGKKKAKPIEKKADGKKAAKKKKADKAADKKKTKSKKKKK
jgi:hypothetical protein